MMTYPQVIRTTVDLPEELLRRAREQAAREGRTLTALLADGLRLVLAASETPGRAGPLPVSGRGGGMPAWIDPSSNASLHDAADRDAAP